MESTKFLDTVARILQIPFMPTAINFFYNRFRGNPELIKFMGAWFYCLDSLADAKIYWECYRKHRPDDIVGLEMMLWIKMGNWEDLTPEFNELQNLKTPNLFLVQITSVYNLIRENKFNEALEILDVLCFDEKTEALYLEFRGHCKGSICDYEGAIKDYQKALKINPNNTDYLCNLALFLLEQDNCQQAEIYLLKALTLNPENNNAKNLWLYLLLKSKRYQDGVNYYHTVKGDIEMDFHARINLAECYFNLAEFELSTEAMKLAERINPHHEEVIALKIKLKERFTR